MKKIISVFTVLCLITISLFSFSACKKDDDSDWKTVEQNGFVLSARVNYNSDKTDIESIDLKMENKTGKKMALAFPTPFEAGFNWWYSVSFSNEEGHYRCSKGDLHDAIYNFDVPAKAVITDTINPKDEDFKKNNSLGLDEILKGDCVLNISTIFFTQEFANGNSSYEGNFKMNLSFDINLNNGM